MADSPLLWPRGVGGWALLGQPIHLPETPPSRSAVARIRPRIGSSNRFSEVMGYHRPDSRYRSIRRRNRGGNRLQFESVGRVSERPVGNAGSVRFTLAYYGNRSDEPSKTLPAAVGPSRRGSAQFPRSP
jgi:hypothetical protein